MSNSSDLWLVLTTTASADLAQAIATAVVEQHLAACAQVIGPIQSTYRWQGAVCTDTEWQCQIKTTRAHRTAVEATIQALHTYDLPEIIAIAVPHTSAAYGRWWQETVEKPD